MKPYDSWLERVNLKKTETRLNILRILDQEHDFLSADDIHQRLLKQLPNVPISTVYRVLEALTQRGLVSTLNVEHKKEMLFELAHDHHAHHLICLNCHKVIHIEECPVESLERSMHTKYGFKVESHSLEFYGYCKECQ